MKNRRTGYLGVLAIAAASLLTACEGSSDMEFAESLDIDSSDLVRVDSGLRYLVLAEGNGDPATKGNEAQISYTGWLTDGTEFDAGFFGFTLGTGMVVAGFDEGVLGMKVNEKRKIVIPPELGYGETGAGGGLIPPGATLVFEIELTGITR